LVVNRPGHQRARAASPYAGQPVRSPSGGPAARLPVWTSQHRRHFAAAECGNSFDRDAGSSPSLCVTARPPRA
jgi:hypothetical protein